MALYQQGYIPPIVPGSPYNRRDEGEMYPIEPIQREVQSPQNQTPSLKIDVKFDEKAPTIPIIKPTLSSVRELANWYRTNGIASKHIPISGARVGNTELPPLGSQAQDFDEEGFRVWADDVVGPSAITMSDNIVNGDNWDNIELDILRKVYGNLALIEQTRALKEAKDIKTGVIHNLNHMRLEQKLQDILDERFGNPLEFKEDIDVLNERIKNNKEYGGIGEEAIDYMFGCIIQMHILGEGKKLTMTDGKPKVETGNKAEDAQWEGVLKTIHFGEKDGQSKIADYVAAYAYHNGKKNLVDYYGDLSEKIIGKSPDVNITPERIEKSNLSPSEKSFMSLWLNKDIRLGKIESEQREYVERANENARKISPESLKRDFHRDAIGTLAKINPLLGASIFVGLFGGLLAMIWSKDSKLAKFVLTLAAALGVGGVALAGPSMLRNFQKNALDNGNAITQAPRRTENTGDALTDSIYELPEFFRDKWNNVSAFFSTSGDWSSLMLDERIGPKLVDKYPTGAILAVLNPDPDNEFNEKWKGTPAQEREIEKILEKLDGDEKQKLNTMLTETWDKYKNANKGTLTNAQLKNGTIQDMIETLDTKYSWFYTRRVSYLFDDESAKQTLIEFSKNPTDWKNAKIGDLMVEWFSTKRTDLPVGRIVPTGIQSLIAGITNNERLISVQKNIQKIWEDNAPCDPEMTLGQLLTKED